MQEFIEIPATKRSLSSRTLLCGIGINDAEYMVHPKIKGVRSVCPFYQVWANMIKRSYSDKTQSRQPTYLDCSVSEEWHRFSNFKAWMEKQDWQNKFLDKDIISPLNKEYSPLNCVFVSRSVNNILTDSAANRGLLPKGVCYEKDSGKYISTCFVNGRQKKIGRFGSVSEAEAAYLSFKSDLVESIAETQEDRIKTGLFRHSKIMRDRIRDIKQEYNFQN